MRNPSGDELSLVSYDTGSPPLIVLVHGFTASKDANFFPALFDRLSRRWSVVRMDLSAHGESEGRFEDMDFPKLESDIETVIDTHGAGRDIVIVGHSMGGALAYRLASRRPDIAGLVLLAPGFAVRSSYLRELGERAIREGTASFTDGFGVERTISRRFFESRDFDPFELASQVRVPTLIAVGELDYTIGQDVCEELADALEDARFERVPDTGHTFGDTDAAIGPLIEEFLERFDASTGR